MSRTFDAANPRKKFTGKERDTESGNDYFLARYYSSNMGGRFLTPDWSKNPQGVPYANYANPQTLNLYAYVGDNPLSLADADGHCTDTTNGPCELMQAAKKNSEAEQSKSQQQGNCDPVSHPCTTVTVHGNAGPDIASGVISRVYSRSAIPAVGVGPYVNPYQPPQQGTKSSAPSAAKLRCENGLIDQALFHGFATAMTNVKGQVATGIAAAKDYAAPFGSLEKLSLAPWALVLKVLRHLEQLFPALGRPLEVRCGMGCRIRNL